METDRPNSTNTERTLDDVLDDIQLDALGLLDDEDRAALDEWLAGVTPGLREQIRAEQERLASTAPSLERVEPSEKLRNLVVRAVLDAIAAEAEEADLARPAATPRKRRHVASASPSRSVRGRRVHPMWRAATLGLCVALVGAGVLLAQTQRYVAGIENSASLSELIDAFGSTHVESMLFEDGVRRVTFVSTDGATEACRGSLWISEMNGSALLFTSRLPDEPNVRYRVAMLDANARPAKASLANFETSGVISRISLPSGSLPATGSIAVVQIANGVETVIMTASLA